MKKNFYGQIVLALVLILSSFILYYIHYRIFNDLYHVEYYLLSGIAFLPIEVLLVTMVMHRILVNREKAQVLKKMNMVIGAFFSEAGTELLKYFCSLDPQFFDNSKNFLISSVWNKKDFIRARKLSQKLELNVCLTPQGVSDLGKFLRAKREFLVVLLENPNLLEHETFTDMLWAVFHLTEELTSRKDANLAKNDADHICIDIKRAYQRLVREWVAYMQHLKDDYPYLFSFAVRTNPFDGAARVEIE